VTASALAPAIDRREIGTGDRLILVAGSNPITTDFINYLQRRDPRGSRARPGAWKPQGESASLGGGTDLVVFLSGKPSLDQTLLDEIATTDTRLDSLVLVSSFRVHFGDRQAIAAEERFVRLLKGLANRVVVFRPGLVASPRSRPGVLLRRFWPLFAFVPANLTTCCVDGEELFAAIERELQRTGRSRTFTLLGPNRSWRDLACPRNPFAQTCFAITATLLKLLLLGPIAALVLRLLSKRWRALAAWNFDTLRPESIQELLSLYNPYNNRHVKVVGYNNGVVHFGQRYPGKTVVSTIRCNRLARVRGHEAHFDCGVTIRQAMDVLGADGKELYVVPNYSYVSLGTAFFVPIHGSASQFCTVGETVVSAILYDPAEDRVIAASAHDPAFGRYLYNLSADVLLLRLALQVKEKSRYYVRKESVTNPSAEQVWEWFHDRAASNVEIRKAGASAREIQVYRYYTDSAGTPANSLELPRDRLGRLWDRLEENPLSSLLFHGLSRRLAHHVELFMSEAEFRAFWDTHASLPIAKIQLRFIKKDGFPHSPFRDHDCISADLFMLKKHRRRFEAYLKTRLPAVKMNPGKHSM
jgi:hypothetical protein